MNQPEPRFPVIAVMTSRDAKLIYEVLKSSCGGSRRQMPPGVASMDDVVAIMRGGVAFFVAYDGADPVGAIGYRWERGTLKIFHVGVKSSHQRCGVGRRHLGGGGAGVGGGARGGTARRRAERDGDCERPMNRADRQ